MDVLLVKDKWDTYTVGNDRGVEWAALDVLRKRLVEDGFWYDDWDDGNPAHQWEERAKAIVAAEDPKAALAFLMERRDHEYEWVEVQAVQGL